MRDAEISPILTTRPLHVLAVGKAAAAMAAAFLDVPHLSIRRVAAIGTHRTDTLPATVEWLESSHPLPDDRSETAALRAIALAHAVQPGEVLAILLSGGASACMAAPIEGISLADKIATTRLMMNEGADIHALNTVRRHLSRVKGGRLAAACVGTTVTLAISDVVGDNLNAIGSGPGVPDPTTWADAAEAMTRYGGAAHSAHVREAIARGISGEIADTPKPSDPALQRARARVIGGRLDAIEGAKAEAEKRGYRTFVMSDPVVGEARIAAGEWLNAVTRYASGPDGPVCVISGGETTVRVTGRGTGGRNLEFSLAMADALATMSGVVAATSIGTDGIDGSSGVAGAIVDSTTMHRASAAGLDPPGNYLAANDSFAFFASLDDVVRLGRTDTNVGDLQAILIDKD